MIRTFFITFLIYLFEVNLIDTHAKRQGGRKAHPPRLNLHNNVYAVLCSAVLCFLCVIHVCNQNVTPY